MSSPLVIAHRGASRAFRENTVEAFRGAVALGADWVELDVWQIADGTLAVHHDDVLPDERVLTELRAGDLPPEVPDLAAALAACSPLGVNVEVKPQPEAVIGPTVDVVRSWGGEVLLSSFDPGLIERVRTVAPDLPTALLIVHIPDPAATVAACVAAGHRALHPWDGAVDPALIARCHDAGLAVNVWTVDDLDRMADLAEWRVDGIVTNTPDAARRLFSVRE